MSSIRRALTEGEGIRFAERIAGSITLYRLPDGISSYHSDEADKRTGTPLTTGQLAAELERWDAIDGKDSPA